ncbi:MAG: ABC transporter ATP-binding protein [Balneolaceae bacterium]
MIVVKNLTKQYKAGVPIFSDLNYTFKEGRGIGLVGANGSGKTTFLRIMSVNSFPTSGTVTYNGSDIHKKPSPFLQNVGLVHDEETLPLHLTAVELLQWVLKTRGLWNQDSDVAIEDMFAKLSLSDCNEPIGTYSTGMKKKTQIAAAMILWPKILILDEPMRGLDQSTRDIVYKMLNEAKKNNTLILMASHSMNVNDLFFDEILEFPL